MNYRFAFIAISIFVLFSVLHAERYVTSVQPQTSENIKKFGEKFYDMENVNAYPIPHILVRPDGKDEIKTAHEIEKPFHRNVAHHIRKGMHDMTPYDWKNFIDYAEKCGWTTKKK